jgi:inorganic pyrophosphatase
MKYTLVYSVDEKEESLIYFMESGNIISPWHDIPYFNKDDGSYNMITEIPKGTVKKMEMSMRVKNPIHQDRNNDLTLRSYPYEINWNYGFIPQTWEDPSFENKSVEFLKGDNDPIDVIEIGSSVSFVGKVSKVKVLGVYAMIDAGELDWKLIVIDLEDPSSKLLNDVNDIEKHFPGELDNIKIWFRDYKVLGGGVQNRFGLGGVCLDSVLAKEIIYETHMLWNSRYVSSHNKIIH